MSNHAHRPRHLGHRFPYMPGVVPAIDEHELAKVHGRADAILPRYPGTVIHVLVLDRDAGLELILERFGRDAADTIRGEMQRRGPLAHPFLACRVPFTWDTDRATREAR